jgi:hypothetical protein
VSLPGCLDPRWEWYLLERLGMPDEYIRLRCLHSEVVPVELVTGELAALLCITCDRQLPA